MGGQVGWAICKPVRLHQSINTVCVAQGPWIYTVGPYTHAFIHYYTHRYIHTCIQANCIMHTYHEAYTHIHIYIQAVRHMYPCTRTHIYRVIIIHLHTLGWRAAAGWYIHIQAPYNHK